ncbi:hypothetical protein [Methanohalophilus sp.]|uniref:hypothetical protein n=1 Tax=Methanohalophilus sp. TaxID=1966352 RepID=UPI00263250BA|nr:hypothetical protein [Methanohalophilus sp.]MDK2892089.1 hypothetical protein [Methanohalophilus sp.]
MKNNNSNNKKGELGDEEIEDTEEEIKDWCESFVEPENEMTDADRQISEWCRLEVGKKKKDSNE